MKKRTVSASIVIILALIVIIAATVYGIGYAFCDWYVKGLRLRAKTPEAHMFIGKDFSRYGAVRLVYSPLLKRDLFSKSSITRRNAAFETEGWAYGAELSGKTNIPRWMANSQNELLTIYEHTYNHDTNAIYVSWSVGILNSKYGKNSEKSRSLLLSAIERPEKDVKLVGIRLLALRDDFSPEDMRFLLDRCEDKESVEILVQQILADKEEETDRF